MVTYKSSGFREIRLTVVLCFVIIVLGSCQGNEQQNNILFSPTFDDPHNHVIDINQTSLPAQTIAEYTVVEVTVDPSMLRENVTLNQSGTFKAFTTHTDAFHIYVENTVDGTIVEIQGFPSLWRPLSDLVWLTDDVLVFDRWSNPHYGVHYVVDIRERRLLAASPFPDQVPPQK